MNAYLLLDNGFKIEGSLFGNSNNILGQLTVNEQGVFILHNVTEAYDCVLTESSTSLKEGLGVFFSANIDKASDMMNSVVPTYAKLIVDELSIDYHLYDLKTYIPNTLVSVNSSKSDKEAA